MKRSSLRFFFALVVTLSIACPSRAAGPSTGPAVPQEIEKWIQAGIKDAGEREAAEVAISYVAPETWPAVEAALKNAPAQGDAKAWIDEMLERQRSYFEHRMRFHAVAEKDWQWNLGTALEAYDRVGRKNPKW